MLDWLDTLARDAGLVGLLVLFASSLVEYVFPPFPGDTITVAGGFYAVRGGIPVAIVFAVLMAGSLAGASIDYWIGVWVGRRLGRAHAAKPARRFHSLTPEKLADWEARFRRSGDTWLAINRFLPGVRGPIFAAAGASQVPYGRVLVFGGLSSLAWNAMLFGAGYFLGHRAERVQAFLLTYGRVVSVALALAAAVIAARWLWRRYSAASSSSSPSSPSSSSSSANSSAHASGAPDGAARGGNPRA